MRLRDLLWSRPRGFILYIIAGFLPVLNDLGMNLILAMMVGLLTNPEAFWPTVGVALFVILLTALLQVLSRFMRTAYMRDTLYDVRRLAFKKVLNQSYQSFAAESRSTYISRLVNDINLFERDFFESLLNVMVKLGNFVLFSILMVVIDVYMGLFTLAVTLIMTVIGLRFKPKIIQFEQDVSEANEAFAHEASNTLAGFEILRLNRVEKPFEEKFTERVSLLEKVKQKLRFFQDLQGTIFLIIGQLFTVVLILYIAWRISNNQMDLMTATFLVTASNMVIWNMVHVFPMYNAMKAAGKIYEKICIPGEENSSGEEGETFRFNETIEAENVSFAYKERREEALSQQIFRGMDFVINKGEKVLLKGASGAGKTTLLQLLSKVYKPDEGRFLIDGKNLSDFSDLSVNESISYVYQNVFLFEDTIRENIKLYQDYPDELLEEVVDKAGLRVLVDSLPRGLDTPLSENGRNLSGGQRQRISIARALIRQTPLVFVDEATSGLDPEMGEAIEKTILSLPQTVLAISHRYYKGVSERYDKVLKIQGKDIEVYNAEEYFRMEGGEPL